MLYGRDEQCAHLDRALADARLGSSSVTAVTGEPGIGKTELLRQAIESARSQGMKVLRARGVESEAEAPFGGLLELLRPALDELERIPAFQAEALRGALALGPPTVQDRFVIGAATLSMLSVHSEHHPLLVVIDDAHWLDESSLSAVLFAARRLVVDPVAVIMSARLGEAERLEAARLPTLELRGVDHEAAARIVGARTGSPASPELIERLIAATGGNPLALMELVEAGTDLEAELLEGPLRIDTSVTRAYGARIAALPVDTRRALALAAAEDSGALGPVAAAGEELGLRLADLEAAESSGLLSVSFGELTWRHPLVRSAAYEAISADERRPMHAALALHADPDHRAWHLAAATLEPDEAVAGALEDAGRRAFSRGAYGAASAASERAARLSPAERSRSLRLFAAAEAAWLGGNTGRALDCLDETMALHPDPGLQAQVRHLRGQAAVRAGDVMTGHDLLMAGAAQIERSDPALAVTMLAEAAEACIYAGRPAAMLDAGRRAWNLLTPASGERETVLGSLALGAALVYNGEGDEGAEHIRKAAAVLEASDTLSSEPRSLTLAALAPLWLREAETGASIIDRAIETARAQGALGALPYALALAAREAATGDRWAVGRALYEEAIALARETEQSLALCGALAGVAMLDARQGREDECRRRLDEAFSLTDRHGLAVLHLWALGAEAELELGLGRLDRARELLEDMQRRLDEMGVTDPDLSVVPELIEAQVRAGEANGQADHLNDFARLAELKHQPWALARLERTRALIAGPKEFEERFRGALRLHEASPDRFEEARTRLWYGERLRRARRRVQAREQLRAALASFESLGATPWVERARSELLATGERARRRDTSTLDELTPQELQIGMFLADGHTTREAATRLFLSPKTVEYHLRNAYRKLGIHSREELAKAIAPDASAARRPED